MITRETPAPPRTPGGPQNQCGCEVGGQVRSLCGAERPWTQGHLLPSPGALLCPPREGPRGAPCRAHAKLAASAQSQRERQGRHQLSAPEMFQESRLWEFPGGPLPTTQGFHCPSPGPIPGQGAKILQGAQCSEQQKRKKRLSLQ